MKKKTEKEEKADKEYAKSIVKEYSYLDTMRLEGWIWEFVRRSDRYKTEYQELEKAVKTGLSQDNLESLIDQFRSWTSNAGLFIWMPILVSPRPPFDTDHHLYVPLSRDRFTDYIPEEDFLKYGEPFVAIPKPDARFIDLSRAPVLDYPETGQAEWDERVRKGSITTMFGSAHHGPGFEINPSLGALLFSIIMENDDFSPDEGVSNETLLRNASDMNDSEDMVYIAVSKNAQYNQLKKHLLPGLKKHLHKNKPRKHLKEWKVYLVAYDLREQLGDTLNYENIADILAYAYSDFKIPKRKQLKNNEAKTNDPVVSSGALNQIGIREETLRKKNRLFDARNCENYHDEACSLIKGGYKRYLLRTK